MTTENLETTKDSGSDAPTCSLVCEDCGNVFDATAAVHPHPYPPGGTYLACPTCESSHLEVANQPDFTMDDLEWAEKHPELSED
jgi:Zn finger protein HypA/HybF involved in hydrogenase expression